MKKIQQLLCEDYTELHVRYPNFFTLSASSPVKGKIETIRKYF